MATRMQAASRLLRSSCKVGGRRYASTSAAHNVTTTTTTVDEVSQPSSQPIQAPALTAQKFRFSPATLVEHGLQAVRVGDEGRAAQGLLGEEAYSVLYGIAGVPGLACGPGTSPGEHSQAQNGSKWGTELCHVKLCKPSFKRGQHSCMIEISAPELNAEGWGAAPVFSTPNRPIPSFTFGVTQNPPNPLAGGSWHKQYLVGVFGDGVVRHNAPEAGKTIFREDIEGPLHFVPHSGFWDPEKGITIALEVDVDKKKVQMTWEGTQTEDGSPDSPIVWEKHFPEWHSEALPFHFFYRFGRADHCVRMLD